MKTRLTDALVVVVFVLFLAVFAGIVQAGTTSDPYTGTPIQVNGAAGGVTIFEAENYDKGADGVAFHNPNPGDCTVAKCSCTQAYRFGELPICGGGGDPFITYTDNGLWAMYTVEVAPPADPDAVGAASYTLELLVAIGDPTLAAAGVAYHARVDGKRYPDVGSYQLGGKPTADWSVFEWRGKSDLIPLSPGVHTILIAVDKRWFNWSSVRLRYAQDTKTIWSGYGWVPVVRVFQ